MLCPWYAQHPYIETPCYCSIKTRFLSILIQPPVLSGFISIWISKTLLLLLHIDSFKPVSLFLHLSKLFYHPTLQPSLPPFILYTLLLLYCDPIIVGCRGFAGQSCFKTLIKTGIVWFTKRIEVKQIKETTSEWIR